VKKNTERFFEELNNECNPEILLQLAKQSIFFTGTVRNKIKNHQYVVDISILNNQFFMVNSNVQYERLKYWF